MIQREGNSPADFEDGRGHVAINVGDLWELRMAPGCQPARKQGPRSCSHKELNLASDLNLPSEQKAA